MPAGVEWSVDGLESGPPRTFDMWLARLYTTAGSWQVAEVYAHELTFTRNV